MGKDLERRFKLGIEKIKNNSLVEEEVYREKIENIYLANDFITELNNFLDLNEKFVELMEIIVVDRYLDDPDNRRISKETILKQGMFEFEVGDKWFVRLSTNIVNDICGVIGGYTRVSIFNKNNSESFIQYIVNHDKKHNVEQDLLIEGKEVGTISNNEFREIDTDKKGFSENKEEIEEFVEDMRNIDISERFVKAVENFL